MLLVMATAGPFQGLGPGEARDWSLGKTPSEGLAAGSRVLEGRASKGREERLP